MKSLTELLNLAQKFTHDGKQYEIVELDITSIAKYTVWLKERAMLQVEQVYLNRPDDPRFAVDRKQVLDSAAAGHYDWGGEVCLASVQTPKGVAKLLELSIFQAGGLATYEECETLVANKQKEILPLIQKSIESSKGFSGRAGSHVGKMFAKFSHPTRSNSVNKKSKRKR